ncbi:tRNA pseudouridine(55) synthase TruB [Agathobaculum sp.]|uniref:tRNA pseudouridine(55) synthase TruB n=1 Tax=Agathobaculum sp. TaxID=2048138 RepID=UPI002A80C478|nr:tRNA pseudouridine(55) synthase TruB [Agathobaculum sp.]MDY3618139.1 tRNA pseudouridine(55) synthase TruB [Agathobaculum sp.]
MPNSEFSGILLMDKPQGFTSHDVVAKLRGILRMRRIGHGGTLDPLATGVLPVFIGGATKAADFAAAQDKEYIAGFTLGFATDTQDTTGQTTEQSALRVRHGEAEAALARFLGEQEQVPPMYSAVKVNGQKLYDLARKGREVERPARPVTVHELELLSFDEDGQTGTLRCVVSKGTYVRTLIHDFGVSLGTFACMHSLRRTRSGTFPIESCVDFAAVERAAAENAVAGLLLPTDRLFESYPVTELTDEGAQRASRGAVVFPRMAAGMPETENALCRVYHSGRFLMLGQVRTLDMGGLGLFVYKRF